MVCAKAKALNPEEDLDPTSFIKPSTSSPFLEFNLPGKEDMDN